jgi:hypothetical protein
VRRWRDLGAVLAGVGDRGLHDLGAVELVGAQELVAHAGDRAEELGEPGLDFGAPAHRRVVRQGECAVFFEKPGIALGVQSVGPVVNGA